jgi:hypothetical protein
MQLTRWVLAALFVLFAAMGAAQDGAREPLPETGTLKGITFKSTDDPDVLEATAPQSEPVLVLRAELTGVLRDPRVNPRDAAMAIGQVPERTGRSISALLRHHYPDAKGSAALKPFEEFGLALDAKTTISLRQDDAAFGYVRVTIPGDPQREVSLSRAYIDRVLSESRLDGEFMRAKEIAACEFILPEDIRTRYDALSRDELHHAVITTEPISGIPIIRLHNAYVARATAANGGKVPTQIYPITSARPRSGTGQASRGTSGFVTSKDPTLGGLKPAPGATSHWTRGHIAAVVAGVCILLVLIASLFFKGVN